MSRGTARGITDLLQKLTDEKLYFKSEIDGEIIYKHFPLVGDVQVFTEKEMFIEMLREPFMISKREKDFDEEVL